MSKVKVINWVMMIINWVIMFITWVVMVIVLAVMMRIGGFDLMRISCVCGRFLKINSLVSQCTLAFILFFILSLL